MEQDGAAPNDDPVLPIELFGCIIDMVGTRSTDVLLTTEQGTTLQACALVCRSFLSLSRMHIFRLVRFGLCQDRWHQRVDRLVQLLETQPGIQTYIRQFIIDLQPYYGRIIKEPLFTRCRDVLLRLPAVEAITIYYSSHIVPRLKPDTDAGSFCQNIIDACASTGNLQYLFTKKTTGISYPPIFAYSNLHTLRIDRGDFPSSALTQPIESVRILALRKMEADPSVILYFPNLEELRLVRVRFLDPSRRHCPWLPPCGIKTLVIELCSMSGEQTTEITTAFSKFLLFFCDAAREHGRNPFENIASLEVLMVYDTALPILQRVLKNVRQLKSFSYEAFPVNEITLLEAIKYLKSTRFPFSFSPAVLMIDYDLLPSAHSIHPPP